MESGCYIMRFKHSLRNLILNIFRAVGDNIFLATMLLTCLVFIAFIGRYSKMHAIISLIILLAYSCPLLYNLIFNNRYGSGLLWWFYLIILSSVHLLVNIFILVLTR